MADIEPPSFSLGLDFDNIQPPPVKPNQHQPLEPPSFSLGLDVDGVEPPPLKKIPPEPLEPPPFSSDLDFDNVKLPLLKQNTPQPSPQNDYINNESSKLWVSDSEPDSPENQPPFSRFRRLRRGGPSFVAPIKNARVRNLPNSVEDDIEDFSEEEAIVRTADPSGVYQYQTLCSSSKLRLSGCGVLRRPQESTIDDGKRKQDSNCHPSTSVASNKGKSVFPEFTSSPLRRFQLIDSDSDSDDPSEGVKVEGNAIGVDLSRNIMQNKLNHGSRKTAFAGKTGLSASTSLKQDLWKNFRVENNASVPTPVFDELLDEYYKGGKQNKTVSGSHEFGSSGMASSINNTGSIMETETLETTGLPCHRYYFHDDIRIRRLVRSLLPYFCPLSVSGDTGNMPYNASSIDYRSQFGNEDNSKQRAGRNLNTEKSTKRASKRNKKANTVENSHETGNWIDPKQTTGTPKDASRRRVRADGQSPGHWVNGGNGKKIYITRTGKELTGRIAYIRYKKENGGLTKSGKKQSSKKK